MQLQQTLEELGFSKNEAQVYLCLLEMGEATGYTVSKKLYIKKPTAYFILEELRKKGLARRIPKSGKHIFQPVDPTELVELARKRVHEIENAVPKLLAHKRDTLKPTVTYFEGTDGMRDGLRESVLRAQNSEMIGFFAYEEKPTQEIVERIESYFTSLKENGTSMRAICPDHPSVRVVLDPIYKKLGWQVRYLPLEEYPSKVSFQAANTTTWIVSRYLGQTLMIENPDTADSLRYIFETVWKVAKE